MLNSHVVYTQRAPFARSEWRILQQIWAAATSLDVPYCRSLGPSNIARVRLHFKTVFARVSGSSGSQTSSCFTTYTTSRNNSSYHVLNWNTEQKCDHSHLGVSIHKVTPQSGAFIADLTDHAVNLEALHLTSRIRRIIPCSMHTLVSILLGMHHSLQKRKEWNCVHHAHRPSGNLKLFVAFLADELS